MQMACGGEKRRANKPHTQNNFLQVLLSCVKPQLSSLAVSHARLAKAGALIFPFQETKSSQSERDTESRDTS